MAKEKNSDKSTVKLAVTIGVITLLLVAVVIALGFLFQTKEQHISTEYDEEQTDAVVCTAGSPMDMFFKTQNVEPVSTKSTMKVTAQEGEIDKIFYTLEQTYENNEQAKQGLADLSTQYGIYMGKAKDTVSDTFTVVNDTGVKAALLAEWDDLTMATVKPFGLTEEDMAAVNEDQVETLTRVLRDKGYICEVDD